MAKFSWKGKNKTGENQRGVLVAKNRKDAEAILRQRQITVSSVKKESAGIKLPAIGGGVKPRDLAIFTRQFSVMIDAGLPLIQCLEILGSQQKNPNFGKVIVSVRSDVESGATLSDAMRKHPKVFDGLFVNMIAAGEAGGILDQILDRLAGYIEKAVKLKGQVKSALMYPIVVLLVAFGVILIIMYKVIPTFAAMFAASGNELPLPTVIVVAASKIVESWGPALFFFTIVLAIVIKKWYGTYHGRRVLDKLLLKIPLIGTLLQKIAIARFCRTLSTLIAAGVPILDGIEITAKTSGNAIVEDALIGVKKDISEGKTISEPLGKISLFPSMVVSMISVGESTGALDTMLSKVADFYEEEVDLAVATLMSMLEPILIVFLGGVIGFIVIALYLPIFQMAGNF